MPATPSTVSPSKSQLPLLDLIALVAVFFRIRFKLGRDSESKDAQLFLSALREQRCDDVRRFFLSGFELISFLTGFSVRDLEIFEYILFTMDTASPLPTNSSQSLRARVLEEIPGDYQSEVAQWDLGFQVLHRLLIFHRRLSDYDIASSRQVRRVNGAIFGRMFLVLQRLSEGESPERQHIALWLQSLFFHKQEREFLREQLSEPSAERRDDFLTSHGEFKDIRGFAAFVLRLDSATEPKSIPAESAASDIETLAAQWLRSDEPLPTTEESTTTPEQQRRASPALSLDTDRRNEASTVAARILRGEKAEEQTPRSSKAHPLRQQPEWDWGKEIGTLLSLVLILSVSLWLIPRNTFYLQVAWWDAALGAGLSLLAVMSFDSIWRGQSPGFSSSA